MSQSLVLQSYLGEEGVFSELKLYEYGKGKEFKTFTQAYNKALKDLVEESKAHLKICLESVRDIKTLNIRIWDNLSMSITKRITIKN